MAFHLLAITDPGCAVSTRYRIAQFEPYLREDQVRVDTRPWPQTAAEQACLLKSVTTADTVLFQRFLPSRPWLRQIRERAKRLLYDFDDAIIYAESTRCRPRLLLQRWWRFRAMMRCCDAVIAGNSYLATLAQNETPRGPVSVVPTTLALEHYDRETSPMETAPVVGWIGGRWTLPYLEQLRRPLEKLSAEIDGLTIRVIADQAPDLGATRVELIPWSAETEAQELKRLRAGIAPLPEDAWTRGKCGLRLLQYLAAGIPAIASPVGTQAEIIQAGAALSASSESGWCEALRRVLAEQHFPTQGHQLVRERFCTSAWAGRVRDLWCGKVEHAGRVSSAR